MDQGWDHTENEDKLLLAQTWALGQAKHQDTNVSITGFNTISRGGCSDNMGRSGGQELVSLSSEYGKHLLSAVINNVNHIHILLYDLIPISFSYLSTTISNIDSLIKFCQNTIRQCMNDISSVKVLVVNNCKTTDSGSQNCLDKIKTNLPKLQTDLHKLYDSYGYINYLRIEAEKIINSHTDVSFSNPKIYRLIKGFNCSLSEFQEIECLVISARSTIYEIKKAKDHLMPSLNAIPPEHLKSVYFKIKSWSNNIDRMFAAIHDAEINTWCLKYWICKFINLGASNKNSLSGLSVNYIGYFYLYYQKLIKVFPNLLYSNYLRFTYILNKYINCSLIRFKSNINYLSCISSSLTSDVYKIQSLTELIPQLPGLINNILDKLKIAIGVNMTLVCNHITQVWNIFRCLNKEIHNTVNIIICINKLIGKKCNTGIIDCLKKCLNQIKCKLRGLYTELHKLYSSYWYINCLIIHTKQIIKCAGDISELKYKICELIKRYKCSICEFKSIESNIKSIQCVINQLKELKQELCKILQDIIALICVCSSNGNSFEIVIINVDSIKKNVINCCGKIDNLCLEFQKIEGNAHDLKHLLLFTSHYFQILSQILNELECIQSSEQSINPKIEEIKDVPSGIKLISNNINFLKSLIVKMNERRDNLGYIRDCLSSILPKLCKINDSSKKIMELKDVVEGLKKIRCSIDNLKTKDYEQKCLKIVECTDTGGLIRTLTCIKDELNIKSITDKLSTAQSGISSLESVICNTKNLLGYIERIENGMRWIVVWIDRVNKWLDNIIKRFIMCSLQSLSTHISSLDRDNILLDNEVVGMYSLSNVMDYKVVVNRLFESAKKIDQILELIPWDQGCQCISELESSSKIELEQINFHSIMDNLIDKTRVEFLKFLKLEDIKNLIRNNIKDNHLCLCMVNKYILYPQIVKLFYVIGIDLETLSTLSRKFQKYGKSTGFAGDLSQFFIVCVELLDKLSMYISLKYKFGCKVDPVTSGIICFCMYSNDPDYCRVVSMILVLSSLVENIWTMDPETMRMSIESISLLYPELESYNLSPFKSSTKNNSSIYNDIKFLVKFMSHLSIGLIFESLKFLGYYFRSIMSLLPTQSLKVILIYQYLFNIIFSLNNSTNIINLYNILELTFDTVLSNFILIPDLLFKFINDKGVCKNKLCDRKITIVLSSKIVNYKILLVKKSVLNNNRLYNIEKSNNHKTVIKSIVDRNINYNKLRISLAKNINFTSNSYILNTKNTIESRNWGYDTHFEHQVINNNNMGNNYPNLTNREPYNIRNTRKMFQRFYIKLNTQ